MARLNDPIAPAESIDALKRRFVRQNREIARVNSTQSLRIRNLESEISRLLAENIALREQIINLTQETERWRSQQTLADGVTELKTRLECKLQELGGLVHELGGLPQKAERSPKHRRKSGLLDQKRSPNQKNWRNSATIGEITSGQQDGRLPVIVEDKYYPRKTLDAEDLRQTLPESEDISESPEIGPPPVAHFEETEPIAFDTKGNATENRQDGSGAEDVPLPPTLEKRRKRRDSSLLKDWSSDPISQSQHSEGTTSDVTSLKSGAKRKLSARDEEESVVPTHQPDGFKFNRATATATGAAPKNNIIAAQNHGQKARSDAAEKVKQDLSKETVSARKALEPKSTNSPTKSRRSATVADKIAALKEDVAKQAKLREQRRDKKPQAASNPRSRDEQVEEVLIASEPELEHKNPPPKTPAGLDLLSPSTEPSSGRELQPPPEIVPTTSVEEVLGHGGRPSRRPRGAISYAEPNLRDKMRRPTKELVAAVAETAFQRAASIKVDDRDRRSESREPHEDGSQKPNMRVVTIKREERPEDSSWKDLPQARGQRSANADEPPSPLGSRSSGQNHELPSSVLTDRKRRGSAATDTDSAFSKSRNSGAAISALVAGSRKTKPAESDTVRALDDDDAALGKALGKLSIFDGPASSPHSDDAAATTVNGTGPEKQSSSSISASGHSRRHSSHLTRLKQQSQELLTSEDEGPKSNQLHRSVSERAGLGYRGKGSGNELKSSRSTASIAGATGEEGSGARADRAASRRRSMML